MSNGASGGIPIQDVMITQAIHMCLHMHSVSGLIPMSHLDIASYCSVKPWTALRIHDRVLARENVRMDISRSELTSAHMLKS